MKIPRRLGTKFIPVDYWSRGLRCRRGQCKSRLKPRGGAAIMEGAPCISRGCPCQRVPRPPPPSLTYPPPHKPQLKMRPETVGCGIGEAAIVDISRPCVPGHDRLYVLHPSLFPPLCVLIPRRRLHGHGGKKVVKAFRFNQGGTGTFRTCRGPS